MSKNVFSNIKSSNTEQIKPHLVSQTSHQTAVIPFSPLDENEQVAIDTLLSENSLEGNNLEKDIFEVSKITSEIKSIRKQELILLGERIIAAQKILKSYKDGTFTQWLTKTMGSKQTGYNVLAYYDLYQALPSPDLQDTFSKIPQKAAYTLANKGKGGNIEKTIEIINEYHDSPPEEFIEVVKEAFPLGSSDRRKSTKKISDKDLLKQILPAIRKLSDRKSLEKVLSLVEKLLSEPMPEQEDPNQMDWLEGIPHTD